ncbi:hypothetical protein AnigIFM59636_004807 [Aspergillus niger]|uniref:Uncharacterized protein n=2 Tax=Aspergillus TaxID=5052 RepID=A0A370PBL7_ASPPH|nr:uncharacterized protein BO96DRAFT_447337 [Aspergillus niger CBS 101883]RDH14966.1 hypothetical protein M747DRAFT_374645 [Aspergillus niger ATCC 13496]RDK39587.1 hypothetical protein M752DRAFT_296047 [Aspergillus phoenicis ATCC 13157]GKZ92097.1 hypothetical protein AnigIFM59636_004807 [Aspergillus niger]PYH55498.1 hypothetical protein BO96DRAFT_447337 [Aspergillus niger CBS 101883]GLA27832.1 hypothetical protein AnigIFM63326_005050 [Aspergillus niger]
MCLDDLQPKGTLKKDIDRFSSWQELPTGFLLQPHTGELSVALSAPGICMTFQSDIFYHDIDLVNPYYKLTDPYMNLNILGPKIIFHIGPRVWGSIRNMRDLG